MEKEDYQEQLSYKSMELLIEKIMRKLECGKTIDYMDEHFIKKVIEEANEHHKNINGNKNIQKWVKLSGR